MSSYCIVITGLPGSGKTTVGRLLAESLEVELLDKDLFLEELFEQQGVGNSAWRRTLSIESNRRFQEKAQLLQCAVLVSHWRHPTIAGPSGTPTKWLFQSFDKVIELYCECPIDIAAHRFKSRTRHLGHLDGKRNIDETKAWMHQFEKHLPFMFEHHIEVSTINKMDINPVIEKIQKMLLD